MALLKKISRDFIYPDEGQTYQTGDTFTINGTEFVIDRVIENNQGLFALGIVPAFTQEGTAPFLLFGVNNWAKVLIFSVI